MSDTRLPTVLAVDTATEACSTALQIGDQLITRYQIAPQKHNVLIFEMCRAVVKEANIALDDIDALVYGRGPGAFTGVRIAASLVQSIAYAKSTPLVPVSDLQTVAQRAIDQYAASTVCVAMDARMEEVYSACYTTDAKGLAQLLTKEAVTAPAKVQLPEDFDGIGVGTGWGCYGETLRTALGERVQCVDSALLPDAATMIKLAMPRILSGDTTAVQDAFPVYLRHPV